MIALPEGTARAALAALVLVAAAAALQRVLVHGFERVDAPVVASAAPAAEGQVMDLNHLREADLEFLSSILIDGSPEGRISATRALVMSGDVRGVSMLFGAARRHPDESLAFCIGALEILRLSERAVATRHIILELEAEEVLPDGCRSELADRFGLLTRGPADDLIGLVADPAPVVRTWLARRLSEEPGEAFDVALLTLAGDGDRAVRRAAWLAWSARDTSARSAQLATLAASEDDPELEALARQALETP